MFGMFSLWILILLSIIGAAHYVNGYFGFETRAEQVDSTEPIMIAYSDLIGFIDASKIDSVRLTKNYAFARVKEMGRVYEVCARLPERDHNLIEKLLSNHVRVEVDDGVSLWQIAFATVPQWLFPLLLALSTMYILRRRRDIFSVSIGSDAKDMELPNLTFKDVAGVDAAKDALKDVVNFLKNPSKYSVLGAVVPKGVLLYGPPGTGKTLLARCVAGEAKASFKYAAGSSFVEIYVGMGAKKVREIFRKARECSPCIIFIDEIDALASKRRSGGISGGSDEHAHTLTQLLEELDGFDQHLKSTVIVIAATNRKDDLDEAVLRPGRFDRHIKVGKPDLEGRKQILEVHTKKIKFHKETDFDHLAKRTQGFSGAEIKNFVNEAALVATKAEKKYVDMEDFYAAWYNVVIGPVRKKHEDEEYRRMIAYHEAGHAIVALCTENQMDVDQVTIIPRGDAEGMLVKVPKGEEKLVGKDIWFNDLTVTLAGRAAEEVVFGKDKVTPGASSDLRSVTDTVHAMVFCYGMHTEDGASHLTSYAYHRDSIPTNIPQDVLRKREELAEKIVKECYQKAIAIIKKHKKSVDKIVDALFKYETLMKQDLLDILAGKDITAEKKIVGKEIDVNDKGFKKEGKKDKKASEKS